MKMEFKTYKFDGVYKEVLGDPSTSGIWLLYGPSKNGKTTGALKLAKYMSQFSKILYVSAEEGLSKEFIQTCLAAGIKKENKNIQFVEYETIEEVEARLSVRRAPGIVFLDNLTMYQDELRGTRLKDLKNDHPNTLFICIAHEDERKKPYGAAAKLAQKLANVIIRAQGMVLEVGGRAPGGKIFVDQYAARVIHGNDIKEGRSD